MEPIIVHGGGQADAYLHRHGAVAQAVYPNIIMVRSDVRAMDRATRRLVWLHELAHLHQFAHTGDDPVSALEAEAWAAARAWAAGTQYQVRGRARGRLNALAIILGGKSGHPHAPDWYVANPTEPISDKATLAISETTVQETMTLETIFDAIIRNTKHDEFVIVAHGNRDGLALPLIKASRGGVVKWALVSLAADRRGEEVGPDGTRMKTPHISDEDVAKSTYTTVDQIRDLRSKMNKVRARNLKHVAFRACNLGDSSETMQAFRTVFGAASISAPKDLDAYGEFDPDTGTLDEWVERFRKNGFHIAIQDDVAFGVRSVAARTADFKIVVRAKSQDAFDAWLKKHISDQNGKSKRILFHGISVKPANRNAPMVYFVRDREYVESIVHYAG